MKKVIAINIGSRNKHYALFLDGEEISVNDESFQKVMDENGVDPKEVVVGIRIVAPGKMFTEDREINEEYLSKLKETVAIAPLHTKLVIEEIENIKQNYPEIKIFGISDSSFHKSIPKHAKTYAIPKEIIDESGIERQGYHGLSLSSVVRKFRDETSTVPEKMIVCHLGGGSSVTALHDGISVDTSMGWTPLEGLPMTERVGDIDPGVIGFLSEKFEKEDKSINKFLSEECGLEAISQIPFGDIPELLEEESKGNLDAKLALEVYVYKIRKYIGGMVAVLNGCDTLVFTGTVGLRSHIIRERIAKNLDFISIDIDKDKNKNVYEPEQIEFIGTEPNKRGVAVVPIDEMFEIASKVLDSHT